MAEKQGRRSLLSITLQTLRNSLKKHLTRKFGRISSHDSITAMQNRPAPTAPKEGISISSHDSKPARSLRIFSAPQPQPQPPLLTSDKPEQRHASHEKNPPETPRESKTLRVRRFTSRLSLGEVLPRSQTHVGIGRRSAIPSSRIPTPSMPPKGNLYSHLVYEKEGRRNVLSSLGTRGTKMKERGNIQSKFDVKVRQPASQAYSAPLRQNPRLIIRRRPQIQYKDVSKMTFAEKMALAAAPPGPPAAMRKVRVGRDSKSSVQYSTARYDQQIQKSHNRLSSPGMTTIAPMTKMATPKRIRPSRGFEDLKHTQDAQRTKLPIPKQKLKPSPPKPSAQKQTARAQTQTRMQDQVKENDASATYFTHLQHFSPRYTEVDAVDAVIPKTPKELASKLPRASNSSTRRKAQGEKMVLEKLPSSDHRRHNPHSTLFPSPTKIPVLTECAHPRPQVETAMPSQYWLGRFVTLTNAFHYEDSFGEPDIATGFEMPSSYSRPLQGSDDGDLASYRVKRAFMALENLCATEEASASLREFRDGYIKRFGDRWMG
ncbi:uncharacterized protein BJX67DRAFT_117586 [Aspergillus lucknowensis]|uniref:Uncharacterized protein n=1 Tax=Aspergillus lucknowensis TaxID=176173 RepID=A0ABR4LQX3_9EURO